MDEGSSSTTADDQSPYDRPNCCYRNDHADDEPTVADISCGGGEPPLPPRYHDCAEEQQSQ